MPTTNPVPSTDPTDLLFNAEKLDEVVNGTASSFTDRLGAQRRTLAGLSAEFPNAAANAAAAAASAVDAAGYAQAAQDEAAVAAEQAGAADASRVAAEAARDAAMLSAGVYATTAAGLAATTSGQYFNVPAGDAAVSLILYLNSAGVAVEQKRYPSLEALNNLQSNSIRDSVNRRFLSPGGGTFSGGAADTTGAFKIALPAGVSGHMLSIDLIIQDNYGALHLTINGFNYPGGTWYYTGVVGQSSHAYLRAPTIRWGNDGSRDCLWIGETSYNIWAYPQVHVNRVSIGGTGEAGFNSGWDISLVASFAGTVSAPKTASVGQLLGSEAITDLNFKRIFNPGGGTFTGGAADTTGAIKVKLPTGAARTNMVICVTVMDNYGIMRLRIGGFNNDGAWLYTKAAIESDHQFQPQPSIRWGNDGTGDCIWIGELAVNFWAYPQVWITDVVVNSGDYGWAGSGWEVSLVTAFDTVTAGPVMPAKSMSNVNPTFTGTLNGGVVNFPSGGGSTVSTYLGYQAGINSVGVGQYNTFVGYQCGYANTTGYNNTFGGLQTGAECTTGYANSGWGLQVMQHLTSGSFNAGYSIHALLSLTTGQSNNAFGAGAMEYLTAGSSNNAFGMYAGRDTQGSGNLFLGHHAGITANSSNELWISNSETQNLIRGHFVNNRLWVAGGDDDGANEFQVNGSLRFKPKAISTPVNNGDLTFEATSDAQLKIKLKGSDGVVRSVTLELS